MRRSLLFALVFALFVGEGCSCNDPPIQRISGKAELATGIVQFGRVCDGDTGIYRLELRNDGTVPLHISEVVIVGSDAFSVESFPKILESATNVEGSKGEILVNFTPTGKGDYFADLVVKSDDLDRPEVTARLSGSGDDGVRVELAFLCEAIGGSKLEPCPASLNFSDVGVDLSKEIPVVVENQGCALVTMDGVTLTGLAGEADPAGFTVTAPATPFSVTNTITQTVVPTLTPTTADTYVGKLVFDYTDAGTSVQASHSLSMVGTGVQLQLLVTPPSFNFADADISTPQSQTFTILNNGGLAGQIVSITPKLSDPEFSLALPSTMPAPIDAFGQVSFDVTYTPVDAEPDQDQILITTNFGSLPPVGIAGGPVPSIEVNPGSTVDFGLVATGASATSDVVISNIGKADLNITALSFTVNPSTVFSLASAPTLPLMIAPQGSITVTLQFDDNPGIGKDSTGAGSSEVGELSIVNDDPAYGAQGGSYLLFLDTDTNANFVPTAKISTFVAGTQCFSQPCQLDVCPAPAETAAFDGGGSTDPENDTLIYLWEILSAPGGGTAALSAPNTPQVQLAPTFPGRWVIQLTVTDPFGNSNSDITELSVSRTGC